MLPDTSREDFTDETNSSVVGGTLETGGPHVPVPLVLEVAEVVGKPPGKPARKYIPLAVYFYTTHFYYINDAEMTAWQTG